MSNYIQLSEEVQKRMQEDRERHVINPYAFQNQKNIRRNMEYDRESLIRPAFVRDCEKIMNIPYYNRYVDKTQVFSLYRNDDISRRALHVQLVSRIARNIGRALNLNCDLIEAISLGHDLGHTPFGHAGEYKLNEIYHARTGRYFNHNIQSARVLDTIFPVNISLQTLDGIICHNGEMELQEYKPVPYENFVDFDKKMEDCYTRQEANTQLIPATLEACVMRVSDIIAYLGKDRQDAIRLHVLEDDTAFSDFGIGKINAEIINNMTVNIIENSYGKPYLKMDEEFYRAFSYGKKENYELIYRNKQNETIIQEKIYPMFEKIYDQMRKDLIDGKKDSVIYKHHIKYLNQYTKYLNIQKDYQNQLVDDIVVDFIAGMTDDYMVDLYSQLFGRDETCQIKYKGYFG